MPSKDSSCKSSAHHRSKTTREMLPFTSTLFTLVAFAVTLHGTYASYVPTCQDEYLSGDTLNAQCRNEAGQYVSTSLGLDDCVANYGGQLTCVHGK